MGNNQNISFRYVLHGSGNGNIAIAEPRQNRRIQFPNGKETVVFDQKSFHASPLYWIALAYAYRRTPETMMGVSLYEEVRRITIHGKGSLDECLERMYGKGGYVYFFESHLFHHAEGLGTLEVISSVPVQPVAMQRVKDPVALLRKLGIEFVFKEIK